MVGYQGWCGMNEMAAKSPRVGSRCKKAITGGTKTS